MTSIVLFNYGRFQEKVDIKVLANDIALKIVEAQKAAMSGKTNDVAAASNPNWKPSYGVYFYNTSSISDRNHFIYFADLDSNKKFSDTACTGECLDDIKITKNDYISLITVFDKDGTHNASSFDDLSITFVRPSSEASIKLPNLSTDNMDYVQVTLTSPSGLNAFIDVYSSGRIQIK